MLRTELNLPMVAVCLESKAWAVDGKTKISLPAVLEKQWIEDKSDVLIRGKRVVVVDECDDTRQTLCFAVEHLRQRNGPSAVACFVVHNKTKKKRSPLPPDVLHICGAHVPDAWLCYPWDASAYGLDLVSHESLANGTA